MEALVSEQYNKALKNGLKYMKAAEARGESPYPPVLDTITETLGPLQQQELGLISIPSEWIVGTKTAGRMAALAGNFMPLLDPDTEFGAKWRALCLAHLSDEGIRDPIRCFEYLGSFYVQEGNKRVSVLKSFDAPSIPGLVTRLLPPDLNAPERALYREFIRFQNLSGLYSVRFSQLGRYERLLAALGKDLDTPWSEEERRSFSAGFTRLKEALTRLKTDPDAPSEAEALLTWLEVYPFADIKALSLSELCAKLKALLPDMLETPIKLATEAEAKEKSLVSKLIGAAIPEHLELAFIYGFPVEQSAWTRGHDLGRAYLEEAFGQKLGVRRCFSLRGEHYEVMEQAVKDGARLLFATTPPMIEACRRIAAEYKNVKVLNCSLSQPYPGVRSYYSRIYECKFITGALAGAMAETDLLGYVANYPIFGTPAGINAFALGARLTNPRARAKLVWSCLPGDPVKQLREAGVSVISNRDSGSGETAHRALDYGVYALSGEDWQPLAVPVWQWGPLYEKIVRSVLDGGWDDKEGGKAINYWWGLKEGVIDVSLAERLPEGLRRLAELLKSALRRGELSPFSTAVYDQSGIKRCDAAQPLSPEDIMRMDWLCDSVEGSIPDFDSLLPRSQRLVRLLGVYRDQISPLRSERQL